MAKGEGQSMQSGNVNGSESTETSGIMKESSAKQHAFFFVWSFILQHVLNFNIFLNNF